MAIGKKAYYFSIIILLMLSLVIFMFNVKGKLGVQEQSEVKEARIKYLDNYIGRINKDFEQAAYIAGFRAIIGLTEEYIAKGKYYDRYIFNDTMESLIRNGSTIDNITFDYTNYSHLELYAGTLKNLSEELGINLTITILSIRVYHEDPWFITIEVNYDLHLEDMVNPIKWERSYTIKSELPVTFFEDPVYTVGTLGQARIINKTDVPIFVNITTNDTSNLSIHIDKMLFWNNSNLSPSFLQRMQGIFDNPSPFGIESLINIPDMDPLFQYNKTIRDWIYFDATNNPTTYQFHYLPNWVRLDNQSLNTSHGVLERYQVFNITR